MLEGAHKIGGGYVEISAKTDRLMSDINGLKGRMVTVGTAIGKAFAVGFAGAVAGIGVASFKGIQMAATLGETMSKVRVIFEDAAEGIIRDAEMMSKKFGIARNDFLEGAANFGAVANQMGLANDIAARFGSSMAKLALDMSSFDNTSVEQAMNAIRTGLSGETEPLKRFRVNVLETRVEAEALALGFTKTGGSLSEYGKMAGRVAAILKDTAKAQGDLERTSGSAANQFRRMGGQIQEATTALGEGLMPIALTFANEFSETMNKVRNNTKGLGDDFKTLVEAIQDGVKAIAVAIRNMGSLWELAALNFEKFKLSAKNFGAIGEGKLHRAVGRNAAADEMKRLKEIEDRILQLNIEMGNRESDGSSLVAKQGLKGVPRGAMLGALGAEFGKALDDAMGPGGVMARVAADLKEQEAAAARGGKWRNNGLGGMEDFRQERFRPDMGGTGITGGGVALARSIQESLNNEQAKLQERANELLERVATAVEVVAQRPALGVGLL